MGRRCGILLADAVTVVAAAWISPPPTADGRPGATGSLKAASPPPTQDQSGPHLDLIEPTPA